MLTLMALFSIILVSVITEVQQSKSSIIYKSLEDLSMFEIYFL